MGLQRAMVPPDPRLRGDQRRRIRLALAFEKMAGALGGQPAAGDRYRARFADGCDPRLWHEIPGDISERALWRGLELWQTLCRPSQAGWRGLPGGLRGIHHRESAAADRSLGEPERRRALFHDRRPPRAERTLPRDRRFAGRLSAGPRGSSVALAAPP